MTRRLFSVLLALSLVFGSTTLPAQRRFRGPTPDLDVKLTPYDGRFVFARLKFTTAPGGFYYMGLPAWAHGFPKAENNLGRILKDVSTMRLHIDASNLLALDDPELFKFPVAYMAEPDYWTMNDKEAASLRAYVLKGGFIIFDDFRDDFRNQNVGWANFLTQMRRIIPDARFIDLDPEPVDAHLDELFAGAHAGHGAEAVHLRAVAKLEEARRMVSRILGAAGGKE